MVFSQVALKRRQIHCMTLANLNEVNVKSRLLRFSSVLHAIHVEVKTLVVIIDEINTIRCIRYSWNRNEKPELSK